MTEYFSTRTEAEAYKEKHKLFQRTAMYIPARGKWALVFDIQATTAEERKIFK